MGAQGGGTAPGRGPGRYLARLSSSAGGAAGGRAIAALLLVAFLALAWHMNARPRHAFVHALPDTFRTLGAAGLVFALTGLGTTRILLPAALRRHEILWILPAGACVTGLALTVLGFGGLPFPASLPLLLVAGLALSAYAVKRHGTPEVNLPRLAWPLFIAVLILGVALMPMVLRQHYAAPVGEGSDAHVATGAANFLKYAYPSSTDIHQPINQMPPTWKSKFPIYYAFAAVSAVSGLATWQALAPLAALLLALAAVGLFLLAREVFRARAGASVAAMGLAGLDRMALHTVLNPYFNQTWGYFAMPFTVVAGWHAVQPGLSRGERARCGGLLAIFGLILVLAYPLAAPLPAVPLLVFAWTEHRRRLKAGEAALRLRTLYHGRRSLLWMLPLAALLAFPIIGAVQKAVSAAGVLAPGHSLQGWAGDLRAFIPFPHFLSLPAGGVGIAGAVLIILLAGYGLRGRPPALRLGLGGLLAIGLLIALYLRHRPYGWYFEFKLLAFIGPLLLLIAALGAARLRRLALPALALLAVAVAGATVAQLDATGAQLAPWTIDLRSWAAALPAGASIRLDMWPPDQIWAAYFLDARPLCSRQPLLATDYPHVATSRKADYIVATLTRGRPADAIGPALRRNSFYALYRENTAVPGPSACTFRRYDRIYSGPGHSPT